MPPPPPPQRVVPPECRAEVDQAPERIVLPATDEVPCAQVDHNEWAICVVAKAKRVLDAVERYYGELVTERRRRKACVEFIDGEVP